ncbi:MAG TPA: glycosyltransferase family 4 protein [Spirochaetota bacterium]|nr:glycosyltransferase family 4 protein [Spirochaetota bacterium]
MASKKKVLSSGKPLSILIINYEYPPLGGGGGVATYDLAIEWAKQGTVDVLTSSFRDLPRLETVHGVTIHRVPALLRKSRDAASFVSMLSYVFFAIIKGYRLCRKNRFDVINTHFAVPSGPIGYILGKLFSIPNVLSLHGGDIYDPSKKLSPHRNFFFRRVVKFMLNHADDIVAQSSNTRNNTITYYSPKNEIAIIPLAFHPPEIPKVKTKDLPFNEKDFNIVTIGRLVKRKAMDVLIRSLADIPVKGIKLHILGDGPEGDYLRTLAKELHVSEMVNFAGYVDDEEKYMYLSHSRLFALTSLHEGFGIVYMEAMYCGLPIVCANNGGQVDFLEHERNALLIDVGDVSACRNSITRFYKEKTLYTRCSNNNRKKITEYYAEAISEQYLARFRTLSERS